MIYKEQTSTNPGWKMTTFLLNPYDADLDLANKDDRKLFQDASKGFSAKEEIFDGKKENFSKL